MIIEQLKKIKIKLNYILYLLNREAFTERKAKKKLGYEVNLKKPKTFNEKLLWLKLYWYDDIATDCVDKFEVRKYVESKGYGELLIPLYGVYNSLEDINYDTLPNEYVLKVTHNSGGVVLVTEEEPLNKIKTKNIIQKAMNRNYYHQSQEWVYKHIAPRIICEEYIRAEDGNAPKDFKFFCFNGKVKFLFVASERGYKNGCVTTKFDFYTPDWELLEVKQGYERSGKKIDKPKNLDEMIRISEKLAEDFPQVRVDLYNENNIIQFGELTFFHFSGTTRFEPEIYDEILGRELNLNTINKVVYADEQ